MAETTKYQLHLKGYVGGWDFDSDYVDYVLARSEGKRVDVLIDSLGGSLNTALSVAAAFRNHGDVHVHYSGMNASAATIAGMGAKEITIDSNAFWLVHKASFFIDHWQQANSDEIAELMKKMGKQKTDLETFDRAIAANYAGRCKKSPESLAALMAEEKWLTADEALEWGFVDAVKNVAEAPAELPKSVVMAMQEAGIPLPGKEQGSIIDRITAAISGILAGTKHKNQPSAEAHEEEAGAQKPDIEMEKKQNEEPAKAQNEVKGPAASATPATAATGEPEATAGEKKDSPEVEALKAELTKAQARIAELSKEAGAETGKVVEAGKEGKAEDSAAARYCADMAAAHEIFNSLP